MLHSRIVPKLFITKTLLATEYPPRLPPSSPSNPRKPEKDVANFFPPKCTFVSLENTFK